MVHTLPNNPDSIVDGLKCHRLLYMTRDSVKKKIKKHFGTYSKFCKLAKIDRYHFQRDFLEAKHVQPMEVSDIDSLVDSLSQKSLTLPELRSKLKAVRRALKEAGGVPAFCEANPQFKQGSVNGAIYQKSGYNGIAEKLIKHFGL